MVVMEVRGDDITQRFPRKCTAEFVEGARCVSRVEWRVDRNDVVGHFHYHDVVTGADHNFYALGYVSRRCSCRRRLQIEVEAYSCEDISHDPLRGPESIACLLVGRRDPGGAGAGKFCDVDLSIDFESKT